MSPPSPPEPRPAATVLLLCATDGDRPPKVVMVRRSAKSPFMPSTYVFPGGRVDPGTDGPGAPAFPRAAARECAEEVGVALHPGALQWFDTWITPSAEPRRYHARFFAAFVDPDALDALRPDGRETTEVRVQPARSVLDLWAEGAADLPPPTLATLLRVAGRTANQLRRFFEEQDPSAPILPKWVQQDGAHVVVLPHDPAYGRLPGEGLPAPERIASLPTRFVRSGNKWEIGTCP